MSDKICYFLNVSGDASNSVIKFGPFYNYIEVVNKTNEIILSSTSSIKISLVKRNETK